MHICNAQIDTSVINHIVNISGYSTNLYGARANLPSSPSSFCFNNNNNDVVDSKEVQYTGGLHNSQLYDGSNSFRSSISSETSQITPSNSHLLDHNYAASAYDECFGDSWKGEKVHYFVMRQTALHTTNYVLL